jgi:hypothetical protein
MDVRNPLVAGYESGSTTELLSREISSAPENVQRIRAKRPEARDHLGWSNIDRRVSRIAEDPYTTIESDSTTCPPAMPGAPKPAMSVLMVRVGGIEQRHQNIHVE